MIYFVIKGNIPFMSASPYPGTPLRMEEGIVLIQPTDLRLAMIIVVFKFKYIRPAHPANRIKKFIIEVIVRLMNSLVFSTFVLCARTYRILYSASVTFISVRIAVVNVLPSKLVSTVLQSHMLRNILEYFIFLSSYNSFFFLNKSKFIHFRIQIKVPITTKTINVPE